MTDANMPVPTGRASIDEISRLFAAARRMPKDKDGREDPVATEMRLNRQAALRKEAGTRGSIQYALNRPTDPFFYWQNSNLPYNVWRRTELIRVREISRLLYLTHPIIGAAIDIYSTYPLVGMEMVCPKSQEVADFYNDLFFDQLDYDEFLVDLGREHWLAGEGFALGTFNDLLGTWEADEVLLPEDVKVVRSPFLREPRYEIKLPEHIRKILLERKPEREYQELVGSYPELLQYAKSTDSVLVREDEEDDTSIWIPIDNSLIYQVKRKGDSFHTRGIPLLLRAFRAIVQEEMLNSAQDAVSSRLYTPLILAKIGASAADLGTDVPWVPAQGDLDNFTESLNAALAADFRVITHHFAVDISNVFGRESVPDFQSDFDRLDDRILQAFGMSKTMLNGASSGQTYAADALNRDFVTQTLTIFQKRMQRFVKRRAAVVAEAQGHYDFTLKGGKPVPIMEEIVETDDEGRQRIVQQPKLLLPELKLRAMNLKDEEKHRDFVEHLRDAGVPISMRTRLTNVPIDLDEEIEAVQREQIDQTVAAQRVRRDTYLALKTEGLPIPQDLERDFAPKTLEAQGPQAGEQQPQVDTLGIVDPSGAPLAPTSEDVAQAEKEGENVDDAVVNALPRNRLLQLVDPQSVPAESHEQRADMPRAAVRAVLSMRRSEAAVREDVDQGVATPAELPKEDQGAAEREVYEEEEGKTVVMDGLRPRHIGMRRNVRAFFLHTEDDEQAS